jgi:hypothetical protein
MYKITVMTTAATTTTRSCAAMKYRIVGRVSIAETGEQT